MSVLFAKLLLNSSVQSLNPLDGLLPCLPDDISGRKHLLDQAHSSSAVKKLVTNSPGAYLTVRGDSRPGNLARRVAGLVRLLEQADVLLEWHARGVVLPGLAAQAAAVVEAGPDGGALDVVEDGGPAVVSGEI